MTISTPSPTPITPVTLPVGTTQTGLDQLVSLITSDPGLLKKISATDLAGGAAAADALNGLIVQAIRATGIANNGDITAGDVRDLNAWIRANHLTEWTLLHGDDEDCEETGFHLVQNDGAKTQLFGQNAVDTVADGLYHLGFEICDDRLLNEDGNANAKLTRVAEWLSNLLAADLAGDTLDNPAFNPYVSGSTGTGLDQIVNLITADEGLNKKVATSEIRTGALAADQMNALIIEAIQTTGVANNGDISQADLRDINTWLRTNHLADWTLLHGDDEDGEETGFHLVQNDGASTSLFGRNAVNTVADGIYHLGFMIKDRNLLNEDGNDNASLSSVSEWLNNLLAADLAGDTLDNVAVNPYASGSTGTGLDQLVNLITTDEGLNKKIATSEIYAGAKAADALNGLIIEAIQATGVANNGDISQADLRDLNTWLRTNHLADWTLLHGDDEDGEETGFHLVQNDGASTSLFGRNAVNTVADGIYHLGFMIKDRNLLNEDGNDNASLSSVSEWLNNLLAADLAGDTLDNVAVNPYASGSTGTGLDQLVNLITTDEGLNKRIATSEIYAGAKAADAMNSLIIAAIKATNAADGGTIDSTEVRELNAWLRANHLADWTSLHGDDEDDAETGFHLVQNDGASSRLFAQNAVNTVADGLYHIAFEIDGKRLLNEDGNANASLNSVSQWLNGLLVTDLADGSLLAGVTLVGSSAAGADLLA
ncbi:MAG: hypothetical protein ACOYNF_10655 [Rhodoferax sp.]